jgi:hypothetical protein
MSDGSMRPPSTGTGDLMTSQQFQDELRRIARFDLKPPVDDPLSHAVQKIKDNPTLSQSRLLTRILTALTYDRGEFRRAEASAFDAATLGLVIALMNVARAGTTTHDVWANAVSACDSAAAA